MNKDIKQLKDQCKNIETILNDCDKRLNKMGIKLTRMQVEVEIDIRNLEKMKFEFTKFKQTDDIDPKTGITYTEEENIRLYDKYSS